MTEENKKESEVRDNIRNLLKIEKVPHKTRHARAVQRKTAIKQMTEEKRKRQKKSQEKLKKSIIKPSSGGISLRPNRHANKYKKTERYIVADSSLEENKTT